MIELQDWQQRVIEEHGELRGRWLTLDAFFQSNQYKKLDKVNQDLLQRQWMHMRDYVSVLNDRIKLFKV